MHTNLICHTLFYDASGSFLLMRRAQDEAELPGYWDIPGGSLEGSEAPVECAQREAEEESNIMPAIDDLDLAFHTSNIDEDKGERFVRLIFMCGPVKDDVVLNEEHDRYRWVLPEQVSDESKVVAYLHDCFDVIESRSHHLCQLPGQD